MGVSNSRRENLAHWPWATLLAVLATVALGLVSLVDTSALSFNDYTTQTVVIWGAIGVGRGLAAKTDPAFHAEDGPFTRWVNTFNWATVVAGVVAVVGYLGVLFGDTAMTWDQLGLKLAALIGALGLGRGIAAAKKDSMLSALGGGVGKPFDVSEAIGDENLGRMATAAGVGTSPDLSEQGAGSDEGMGEEDEPPGPVKGSPLNS